MNVPFVALFVLLLGGHDPVTFALSRMVDVPIGVMLGLAVNTAWPPALRDRATERAAWPLAERVAALLRDTAGEVRWCEALPPRHRARQAWTVRQASHALAEAEAELAESRRLNLRRIAPSQRRPAPRPAAQVLAREAEHGGAASAAPPCAPEFREGWSALLELLAELALRWGETGEPPPEERQTETLERYRAMRAAALDHERTGGTPQRWITERQLCALALQLVFELGRDPAEPMAPESLGLPAGVRCPRCRRGAGCRQRRPARPGAFPPGVFWGWGIGQVKISRASDWRHIRGSGLLTPCVCSGPGAPVALRLSAEEGA